MCLNNHMKGGNSRQMLLTKRKTAGTIFTVTILTIMTIFSQIVNAGGISPLVKTEKDTYKYGEMIKVNFSNSPGNDGDWICIVPVGSPDTEGGDYKNMPKGLGQGFLIFDPPSPGKYEARAYYNYSRNGYVVSGRYAFSVVSSPEGEAAMAQCMERKIDPSNPMETNLTPGNGLIYIISEPSTISARVEAEIKVNGKPIIVLPNAKFFQYSVPAGNITFSIGDLTIRNIQNGAIEETWPSISVREKTIIVMPGHVYYLKTFVTMAGTGLSFLEHVTHQEGASSISSNKLKQIKR
jgi:hypothetical protein